MADLRPRRAGYILAVIGCIRVAFQLKYTVGTPVISNFGAEMPFDPIA